MAWQACGIWRTKNVVQIYTLYDSNLFIISMNIIITITAKSGYVATSACLQEVKKSE